MFNTTIIRKTITGIMQSAGGFAEPITRALGIRVRTAAGNSLTLSHDDTSGAVSSDLTLALYGSAGVSVSILSAEPADAAFYDGAKILYENAGRIWVKYKPHGAAIVKKCLVNFDPVSGTTAERATIINPLPLQKFFDTDYDELLYWTGAEWRNHTEAIA